MIKKEIFNASTWVANHSALIAGATMMLVTISCAQFCQRSGLANPVAYIGYGIMLIAVVSNMVISVQERFQGRSLRFSLAEFLIILALLSAGIFLGQMSVALKIRLFLTQLVLATAMVYGKLFLREIEDARILGYGLFGGLLVVFLGSLLFGADFYSNVDEGATSILSSGFNGGMLHKNYFAITLFISIVCLHINWLLRKRHFIDLIVIGFELFLLLLSHARSSWILLAIYTVTCAVYVLLKRRKEMAFRKYAAAFIVVMVAGAITYAVLYSLFFARSMTYMARVNGLNNWIEYTKSNPIEYIIGNASVFFGSAESYYDHFRTITGYSGAVDMALVNILIKSGILGIMAYLIVLSIPILKAANASNKEMLFVSFSVAAPLVASTLSENVASTISLPYVISAFFLLGLSQQGK